MRPGDPTVTFECVWWDAQGRRLNWELFVAGEEREHESRSGNEVTMMWLPQVTHVGIECTVRIVMWPIGASFRRYPPAGCDGRAFFHYRVLPPLRDNYWEPMP